MLELGGREEAIVLLLQLLWRLSALDFLFAELA